MVVGQWQSAAGRKKRNEGVSEAGKKIKGPGEKGEIRIELNASFCVYNMKKSLP